MQKQKGISTLVFIIIIVVLVAGSIGIIKYYFGGNGVVELKCGTMVINMPKDYMKLNSPTETGTIKLDSQGCKKDSMGCLCVKTDKTNIIFSAIEAAIPATVIPNGQSLTDAKTQIELLKNLNDAVKSENKAGEITTDEYTTFQGYQSSILNTKWSDAGTTKIHKQISFIKNSTLYGIDFLAEENLFNKYWPSIEMSIDSLKFTN